MEQEVTNYARFYALLKKLPGADKETLVYQFTGGRTKSLRQMSEKEYESMCNEMERVAGYDERRETYRRELRRKRSAALHQMQLLGIDTADWDRVNDFCRDPRIAGTEFRRLDTDGLEALAVKCRAIRRKQREKEANGQLLN